MSLTVTSVYSLCPAGDLPETAACDLSPEKLHGCCNQEHLQELNTLLPKSVSLRRVPRLARLALRAALEVQPEASAKQALVLNVAYGSVGSTFEFLDSIINDGPALASPTAFSHSVTNMTAAYLCQYLNLTGPALTLTQQSFAAALETAEILLDSGQAETVLLGIIAENSESMAQIEEITGRPLSDLADGAVFFQLKAAEAGCDGVTVQHRRVPVCPNDHPNIEEDSRLFAVSSPLAAALRLALACHELSEKSAGTISFICGDDQIIVTASKSRGVI